MWLPGSLIRFGERAAFLFGYGLVSCNITIVNRAAVIEQLKQTQEMLAELLALLEAGEADKFAAHLYQSRLQYRRTSERPNKGNKTVERTVLASYQVAQSLGFNGDFRAWEHLLRIHG